MPDYFQSRHAIDVRRAGKVARIESSHRRANDKIRPHAGAEQDAQHADLDRAEASAPGEDKCGLLASVGHHGDADGLPSLCRIADWMSLKQKGFRLARQGFKTRRGTIAKFRWMSRRNIGPQASTGGCKNA